MPKDLSGAQTGMAPSNSVNNPRPDNARGRNIFPQSFPHLTTDRYGEYSLFYWAKAERGDIQNLQSTHDLSTFTFKSPMKCNVSMTKSYVKVPMQAIYPINWEKMMTIPTQGDDVPANTRARLNVTYLVKKCIETMRSGDIGVNFKAFMLLEAIASNGSLFARCNMHLNFKFSFEGKLVSFDTIAEKVWDDILSIAAESGFRTSDGRITYFPFKADSYSTPDTKYVLPHRIVEMLRDGYLSADVTDQWDAPQFELVSGYDSDPSEDYYINIEPIIAYQLACAQFGSNDFVDDIFSAQLYRQNMFALATRNIDVLTFDYNGVTTLYDVFSQAYFDALIEDVVGYPYASGFDYFLNLFSYQKSLRYGDYFTGAKVRPLAVGEYSAEVVDGSVSAIDVTKSIQMQRLLNRVNMVGRKLGDYLAGIFGGQLPEAPKDVPIFLAHQRFPISGFTTQNTGDAQLSPNLNVTETSALRSTESRHAFEVEIDEPCYIIGMNSYEAQRIYSKTMDRFAFHHDRYDDFIPQMQYIGDQDINLVELDSSLNSHTPFGYCLRYMEYKQRYGYASGGFIEDLPSWAFITDNEDGNAASNNIDSDYIRSSPSEFDRFYKSLNGNSLGKYYHFIVCHENITSPSRMMEYTPEILK